MSTATRLVLACLFLVPSAAAAQENGEHAAIEIPATATIQGTPTARVDVGGEAVRRHVLTQDEANQSRLTVRARNGRLLWATRSDEPLTISTEGRFTYLSARPGAYIRLWRVRDRIEYAEHVDVEGGSVTYWGELRIVVGTR